MMRLVVDNGGSEVSRAWTLFDGLALELHDMYANPTGASSEARQIMAEETAKAWVRFRELFDAMPADAPRDDQPRPVA